MASTRTPSGDAAGVVAQSGAAASLASLARSRSRSQTTWQDATPQLLQEALTFVVDSGSLIGFGRTSDGGALMLSITTDGLSSKFYASQTEEVDELLREVVTAFRPT